MFELDDEYAESDIPTTLIRSKADCPTVEVYTCTPLLQRNVGVQYTGYI